ncbi:MAG TPA: hypothetical protein VD994_20045 [Prosthecobacter sp.]|nr:hypothetical protein [Prosthecobacter sp.]
MSTTEDSWKDRSYQELMDEAVRLELMHRGAPECDTEAVRARLEDLVMTCSFVRRPDFGDFAAFFRSMCSRRDMHPLTVDSFLRAAWKACDDEAKGVRPIPGKAEVEVRARELRRALILDTEESWAYEGLNVQFRSDLEEGEDPAVLAVAHGQPCSMSIAEMEEGIHEHIENGGLEAYFASVRAAFEERQRAEQERE